MKITSAIKARARHSRLADSRLGVQFMGHRTFVGALWEEMGNLQFQLMIDRGLRPSDTLLDVGCGSLRGGRLFIPYLDAQHYIGVEQYRHLVDAGLRDEVPEAIRRAKRPQFVITDSFTLPELRPRPTFALAQSLFSHLARDDAEACLRAVRRRVADGCRFAVTFFESDSIRPAKRSHSHNRLYFTRREMEWMGHTTGWDCHYIGDFDHPRGQRLMEYVAS